MRTPRKGCLERGSPRRNQRNVGCFKRVARMAVEQRHRQRLEAEAKSVRLELVARRARRERNEK